MNDHDSFLKMIGLDDSDAKSEEEVIVQENEHPELSAAWEEESTSPEIVEEFEEDWSAAAEIQDEPTEKESYYQTEIQSEAPEWTAEEAPEDAYETSVESTVEEVYEQVAAEFSEAVDDEIIDEPTRPSDLSPQDPNNQTSVYSEEEVVQVSEEVKASMSLEDRLLDGLEEAEESRATDIFAQSYRQSSRKTKAAGLEGAAEEWEAESLEPEVSSEENNSWNETGASTSEISSTTDPSRNTLAFSYEKAKSSRLYLLEGPCQETEIPLDLLPLSIGRDPQNNLTLDDSNVSRFHAEIRDIEGQIKIVDLGSTNGIKVNGAIVTEHKLEDHDVVQVGDSLFEYLLSGSETQGMAAARETFVEGGASKTFAGGRFKSNKMKKMAAGLFIFGGLLMAYQYRHLLISQVEEKGQEVVLSQAGKALDDFKTQLEIQYDRPVSELSDSEIQESFMQKLETYKFLPESMKSQLRTLPPSILRIFLEDPSIMSAFIESGGKTDSLKSSVRSKLSERMRAGQYEDAASLVQILLKVEPHNEELLSLKSQIDRELQVIDTPSMESVSDEDREKFFSYMQNFQEQTENLIQQGELEAALQFAIVVRDKTLELIRKQPAFGAFAESAVAEWSSRITSLESKMAERAERREAIDEMVLEGDERIALIKKDMDAGRVYEASLAVDEFLEKYPDHPRADEVKQFGEEITQAVQVSFDSMNSKIETYVKTENFKVAWESLYRFLDLMPGYDKALSLREDLKEATQMRASQYYNQARVFEFEADDLIAAEQYYKKVLETTDPRGDLAKKAERRYSDVRRKSIQ